MKATLRHPLRWLAVGALAVPAIVLGSPNAYATIHHYPANGGTCVGGAVLRCLELRYDDVTHRYRAWAEITDNVNDNVDAEVGIGYVFVTGSTRVGGGPVDKKYTLASGLVNCNSGPRVVGFEASFFWSNKATGSTGTEKRQGSARVCFNP
jgi:hypothetical protein